MFMSGLVGYNIVHQTNFTPSALNDQAIVDAACSYAPYEQYFIITTDEQKVYTFLGSSSFVTGNQQYSVWFAGSLLEVNLPSSATSYPIKKVASGGRAYAVLFGARIHECAAAPIVFSDSGIREQKMGLFHCGDPTVKVSLEQALPLLTSRRGLL